ncbi:ogr/Delta-like zinc finger family protein [Methylobacter sp.]|uniref:ogr/Delta-like zinc finger family protein n=1 Tax=Methylobacter sp. TaxID=2051955 RepID=UPI003DA66DF6
MRIICPHCRAKALITSTNQLSDMVKDLYCTCTNSRECGASFVFTLAYKHGLNPPQKTNLQIVAALVTNLNPADKRRLQQDLFG